MWYKIRTRRARQDPLPRHREPQSGIPKQYLLCYNNTRLYFGGF